MHHVAEERDVCSPDILFARGRLCCKEQFKGENFIQLPVSACPFRKSRLSQHTNLCKERVGSSRDIGTLESRRSLVKRA